MSLPRFPSRTRLCPPGSRSGRVRALPHQKSRRVGREDREGRGRHPCPGRSTVGEEYLYVTTPDEETPGDTSGGGGGWGS